MGKKETQKVWDSLLVNCWWHDSSFTQMVFYFQKQMKPDSDFTTLELIEYINSLDLRRCRDRDSRGLTIRLDKRLPVRAFIANHSSGLSAALFAGTIPIKDVIENINNWKWTRPAIQKKERNERARNRRISRSVVVIKARELDKSHDWSTVK